MYGGLCALATFERSQLHKEVLISNTFKLFLELEPQLRDVIINFYESKYGKCLTQLVSLTFSKGCHHYSVVSVKHTVRFAVQAQ